MNHSTDSGPYQSRFRSSQDAARYLAAYEAVLALWPVPHESMDITTDFGITHINVAGKADMPPLILIPGAQISSTVWYPNIEPLSRHFRVYALDVIDQTGLSSPGRRLKTPRDSAAWLISVMDALSVERATLVGHSQGCWQAMNLAKTAPGRVARIALLSPGPPFIQLRWQMLLRMIPVFISPTRKNFYWNFQWLTTIPLDTNQPHPLVELFTIGALTYKPDELGMGVFNIFTDDELRQIDTPTLLLTGDQERVVRPEKVIERARRLMPKIETGLISNAGHVMPVDQADAVNERMLQFLKAV